MVSERIRIARELAHMSQEELGMKIGLTGSAVRKWESGKGIPYPKNILKISQVLGKSVPWLKGEVLIDHPGSSVTIERLRPDYHPTSPENTARTIMGNSSIQLDSATLQATGTVVEPGLAEVYQALANLDVVLEDLEAAKERARLAQITIKRFIQKQMNQRIR